MRGEYFVLEEDTKTTFAVIGCLSTMLLQDPCFTDLLFYSDGLTSLLFTQREDLST